MNRLEQMHLAAPMQGRPIVFLDIDDVLCLNRPYSGFDIWHACRAKCRDPEAVLANAFGRDAIQTLTALHTLVGPMQFVISSSWRLDFTRVEIERVFACSGLDFVVNGFADDGSWATPETSHGRRADEIQSWLSRYHRGEPFVVLDDTGSGIGLFDCAATPSSPLFNRVTLCEVGVGLVHDLLPLIVDALLRSCASGGAENACHYLKPPQ